MSKQPTIFTFTKYALPTTLELEDINKYGLSAKDVLNGFYYTMVGKGLLNIENKNLIIKSINMLCEKYPNNAEYKKAVRLAEKLTTQNTSYIIEKNILKKKENNMEFTILDNGNLQITATEEERDEMQQIVDNGKSHEQAFFETADNLNGYFSNGWFFINDLSSLGHMTNAPAIARYMVWFKDGEIGKEHGVDKHTQLWIDSNYQVKSFAEDLIAYGKAILYKEDTSDWGEYNEDTDKIEKSDSHIKEDVEILSYKDAIKTPKYGWANAKEHNMLASTSQTIGNFIAVNPQRIYDWSLKYNVSYDKLSEIYLKLKQDKKGVFLSKFLDAVVNMKPLDERRFISKEGIDDLIKKVEKNNKMNPNRVETIVNEVKSLNTSELNEVLKRLNEKDTTNNNDKTPILGDKFIQIVANSSDNCTVDYNTKLYYNSESKEFSVILPGYGRISDDGFGIPRLKTNVLRELEDSSYFWITVFRRYTK